MSGSHTCLAAAAALIPLFMRLPVAPAPLCCSPRNGRLCCLAVRSLPLLLAPQLQRPCSSARSCGVREHTLLASAGVAMPAKRSHTGQGGFGLLHVCKLVLMGLCACARACARPRARRRDLPNNGTAVMRLSPELKDLLDKMFEVKQVGLAGVLPMGGRGWLVCQQVGLAGQPAQGVGASQRSRILHVGSPRLRIE